MPSSNFKLFDENKQNILTSEEYNGSTARLNGVQSGIASSKLHNKSMYQQSLMAYALAQIMVENDIDASDEDAVATFIAKLRNSIGLTALDKCFSKLQSLSSATAALIDSVDPPSTPDSAFGKIISLLNDVNSDVASLVSGKARVQFGAYTGTASTSMTIPAKSDDVYRLISIGKYPMYFETAPDILWIMADISDFNNSSLGYNGEFISTVPRNPNLDYRTSALCFPSRMQQSVPPASVSDERKYTIWKNNMLGQFEFYTAKFMSWFQNGYVWLGCYNYSTSNVTYSSNVNYLDAQKRLYLAIWNH